MRVFTLRAMSGYMEMRELTALTCLVGRRHWDTMQVIS